MDHQRNPSVVILIDHGKHIAIKHIKDILKLTHASCRSFGEYRGTNTMNNPITREKHLNMIKPPSVCIMLYLVFSFTML